MKKAGLAVALIIPVLVFLITPAAGDDGNGGLTPITIAYEGTPSQNYLNNIIDEIGFYKKNGLQVTPKYYDTAKEAAESVTAGESDYAIVNSYAIAETISEGLHPVILSSVFRVNDVNFIIVDQKAGIITVRDLAGKRIGVDPDSFWGYFLDQFLVLSGIDPSSVEIVPVQMEVIPEKLQAGEIDAGLCIYQTAAELRKDDPLRYQMWSLNSNENFYLALVTGRENASPDVTRRLIRSLMDFGDYISTNFDQMRQQIRSKSGVDSEVALDLISGVSPEVSLTYGLLSVLEAQSRYIINKGEGIITETPDYLEIIDFTFLDELNPNGVTIIHQ